VVVLSRAFVRKVACMDEIELFLKRVEDGERLYIMPVFCGIDYDYCFNKLPGAYDTEEWVTTEAKPGPEELKRWDRLVKRLTEFTGKRKDQVGPLPVISSSAHTGGLLERALMRCSSWLPPLEMGRWPAC
jgi:hypothetical protein